MGVGMNESTNQVTPPELRNPTGKGGFGEHPEHRSDGGWDKTKVFSYQYKRFMNMTISELEEWGKTPKDSRTVVEDLAYRRVVEARKSLPDVKEITDRTEGRAPQSIDAKISPINIFAHLSEEELKKIIDKL